MLVKICPVRRVKEALKFAKFHCQLGWQIVLGIVRFVEKKDKMVIQRNDRYINKIYYAFHLHKYTHTQKRNYFLASLILCNTSSKNLDIFGQIGTAALGRQPRLPRIALFLFIDFALSSLTISGWYFRPNERK